MNRPAAFVFVIAALAQSIPAAAQFGGGGNRGRAGATFFVKDDFGGRSVFVDRPVNSFREFDMNDKVSSIGIQRGRWLVCEDDNFRGRCQVIDHSIGKLSQIGMDDRISSARPLDQGGGGPGNGPGGGYQGGGRPGGPGNGGPGGGLGPLPGGSWAQSCRGAQVVGGVLRAECNDGNRNWQPAQLNLRQCPTGRAGNAYGRLVCE